MSIFTGRIQGKLLEQAQHGVAQWIQGARGLAVGGITPGTHGYQLGLHFQGRPSPQDDEMRCLALLGVIRKSSGGHPGVR